MQLCGGCASENNRGNNGIIYNRDYQITYETLLNGSRYSELYTHLQLWENEEPDNPEVYVAYFNYYLARNRSPGSKAAGYTAGFKVDDVLIGVEYLNRGLVTSPERLDMHFGKIFILIEVERNALLTFLGINYRIVNKLV
jgi:hypothetical protein